MLMALGVGSIILCVSSNALSRVFLYVCSYFSVFFLCCLSNAFPPLLRTSFLRNPQGHILCLMIEQSHLCLRLLNWHLLRVCFFQTRWEALETKEPYKQYCFCFHYLLKNFFQNLACKPNKENLQGPQSLKKCSRTRQLAV